VAFRLGMIVFRNTVCSSSGSLVWVTRVSWGTASSVERQKPDIAFSDPTREVRLSAVARQPWRPDDVMLN
jgi:hypothetical protein